MGSKETFETRQLYNAEAISFINRLIVILVPSVLPVFLLYPLGAIHSSRYTIAGYITFNLAMGTVGIIRMLQMHFHWKTSRLIELASLGAIVVGGSSLLLFVTGIQHPIVMFWLIAVIIAHLHFGMKGYWFVAVVITLVAIADVLLEPASTNKLTYSLITLMYGAALNVVAFMLIKVLNLTTMTQRTIITTRKREEQQRERLQAVLDNMAEGLIAVSAKGVVNMQNGTALSVLDTNQTLIGKHLDEVFKLIDASNKSVKAEDLLANKHQVVFRDDLRHQLGQDDFISLSILVTPIRSGFRQRGGGMNSGFVIILRDITRQKSLDEERDEFISVVSHELRTPVAVAEGSIGNLLFMAEKGSDKAAMLQTAKAAHDQVVFLASMINDLGTLSRAERGVGDSIEEIDLNEMCNGFYLKYSGQAMAKGLELKMDIQPELPKIVQSRLYLEETLQNFITNAIKYTREGSVTVHAHVISEGIEMAVSDTGIGISTSDQKRVYEKFFRSEDYRTRENGGTGLGLYVVKKLVDKMGIQIHLESKLNKGSRFSIVLPLPAAEKKPEN